MTYEEACSRFSARRGLAKCPAHEDRLASLSLKDHPDEEHWHPNCFAGCSADAVLGAIGLDYSDTFYGSRERGRGGASRHAETPWLRALRAGEAFCREVSVDPAKVLTIQIIQGIANAQEVNLWPDFVPWELNRWKIEKMRKEMDGTE